MALPLLLLLLLLLLFLSPLPILLIFYFRTPSPTSARRLPPGPRPLPIIGNLHSLSPFPHRDVSNLAKTYGPIIHLRLGSTPTVFISSPSLVERLFKDHDVAISDRSPAEAQEILSYERKGFGFSEYGSYWRKVRRICVNSLLSKSGLESFEHVRREEMQIFVHSLKEAAADGAVVDVTAKVRLLVADIVCRVVMGRKCMEESMDGGKLSEHFAEVMRILGSFNLNDTLPFLRPFDLQGIRRRTMTVREKIDRFLEQIIDEHLQLREEGMKEHKKNDFVDVLLDAMDDKENLELELDRTSIKAMLLEVFLGTLDTSADVIDWALVELLRHPTSMKKVQEELTRVVGPHRMVNESDISKLPYLQMVVNESLRLHLLAPFTFRHTRVDIALDGYTIPAGSNVMICSWAMARDPDFWPDAEEFIPERFENSSLDVKGQDFQLLPFGSGRRICPGVGFGLLFVPLVLAQLVHCFDWELPEGVLASEFEMKEKYGLTMPRAVHLNAIPIRRPVV